ncbi:MAG TPA: hypothetical protein VFD34_02470 [Clostridia bacterium]|nr:hypothetical protein [Clostridia bacterium]
MTLQAYKTDLMNRHSGDDTLLQITRLQAESIHAAGLPLLLLPCKVKPGGDWVKPREVPPEASFEQYLRAFDRLKCNDSMTGYSAAYYTLTDAYKIWLGEDE